MKLWATLAAAGILAGSALATGTTSTASPMGNWTINVGMFISEGDLKDAGVDNGFLVGADWMLGQQMEGASTYAGIMGMFGSGDADLDVTTYGIHYGLLFGTGAGEGAMNGFKIRLQGGYYNSRLEQGSFEADDWGFGGLAGFSWAPQAGGFTIDGGYFFMPEVEGVDNRGWFFSIGIPVK